MFRVSRLGVLAAMWLSWSPSIGTAQQTEEELLQRLDSLRPLLEVATEELSAFEYQLVERSRIEAAAQAKVDTMERQKLRIIPKNSISEVLGDIDTKAIRLESGKVFASDIVLFDEIH